MSDPKSSCDMSDAPGGRRIDGAEMKSPCRWAEDALLLAMCASICLSWADVGLDPGLDGPLDPGLDGPLDSGLEPPLELLLDLPANGLAIAAPGRASMLPATGPRLFGLTDVPEIGSNPALGVGVSLTCNEC